MSYEWFHLVAGVVDVFFGVLGGFYALRALMALYRSPEMLRTQRNIWLPILIGGVFFIVSGILHFAEHSYFSSFFSNFEMVLLRDIFNTIGFSFLAIGIVKYSQLQIEYYKLKREALKKYQGSTSNKNSKSIMCCPCLKSHSEKDVPKWKRLKSWRKLRF